MHNAISGMWDLCVYAETQNFAFFIFLFPVFCFDIMLDYLYFQIPIKRQKQ